MKIRKIAQTPGLVATVVDNLTSTSTTDALSANQGKVLNEKIINKADKKKIYNITIDTNWTELNTKIVELQGIEETDIVNVYPIWSENKETRKKEKEEYAKISMVKSTENNIELICDEGTPNINLNLRIEVVY